METKVRLLSEQILEIFPTEYKRFSNFIDSGFIWDCLMDVANDNEYMKNIVFCNDIMGIPPVETFLAIKKNQVLVRNHVINNAVSIGVIMETKVRLLSEQTIEIFPTEYKSFSNFIDSGFTWDCLMGVINDNKLMKNIIFCNDIMGIPPVKTFLMTKKDIIINSLTKEENRSIGAVFGCIFKFIFGYEEQERILCSINTVKTATRF